MSASDRVLADLKQRIAEKQVIFVLGTGVTNATLNKDDSPAKDWQSLLLHGIDRCGPFKEPDWQERHRDAVRSGDLSEMVGAADRVKEALDKRAGGHFDSWLREVFEKLSPARPELIRAIKELQCPIATTNYDHLIEKVTKKRSISWNEATKVHRFLQAKEKGILHLHGHWEAPESVVMGTLDYERLVRDELPQFVQRLMSYQRSLVYVGCGGTFRDPNFECWLEWMRSLPKNLEIRHYRLAKDDEVEKVKAEHSPDEPIQVLGYGPKYDDLHRFIANLKPEPRPRQPKAPSKAAPKATPSNRLRDLTETNLNLLRPYASLAGPSGRILLPHAAVDELVALSQRAVTEGQGRHIAVVGEPGLGKTGVLVRWLEGLSDVDHVLLRAKDWGKLALGGSLSDELKRWSGEGQAWLVVDGLEELRDEQKADELREALSEVDRLCPRWRIVASIRSFDLRYSPKLRCLFRKRAAVSSVGAGLEHIVHVTVNSFRDVDLDSLNAQHPELAAVWNAAPEAQRALLRTPSLLSQVADLIHGGQSLPSWGPLWSHQLIYLWWESIVGDDPGGKRRGLIQQICRKMAEARRLRVANDGLSPELLHELGSAGLVAIDGDQVEFNHPRLLDWALQQYWLPSRPEDLVERFTDGALARFCRSAAALRLQRVWDEDRSLFWETLFALYAERSIPELVRLRGVDLIAREAHSIGDWEPLVARFADPNTSPTAWIILLRVIGVARARSMAWVGPGVAPWCEVGVQLSEGATTASWQAGFRILMVILRLGDAQASQDKALKGATPAQRSAINRACVLLLDRFVVRPEEVPEMYPRWTAMALMRTFEADPLGAATALRATLASEPPQHFYRVFSEADIEFLIQKMPELATEVYRSAFVRTPPAEWSQRADAWSLLPHNLVETYVRLVPTHLLWGTRALRPILENISRSWLHQEESLVQRLTFQGRSVGVFPDGSIWKGKWSIDIDLREAWTNALIGCTDQHTLQACLDEVLRGDLPGLIWRALLRAGAEAPGTIGRMLAEVAASPALLEVDDTRELALKLRQALQELAGPATERPQAQGESAEASSVQNNDMPEVGSTDPFDVGPVLLYSGLLPTEIQSLMVRMRAAFAAGNGDIHQWAREAAETLLQEVEDLWSALSATEALAGDFDLGNALAYARACIAETASRLARVISLQKDPVVGARLCNLLLSLSVALPSGPPFFAEEFRCVPSIESVAEALLNLAPQPDVYTSQLGDELERLARAQSAGVRITVLGNIHSLYDTDQPRYWRIVQLAAASEVGPRQLVSLVHQVRHLSQFAPGSTSILLRTIWTRLASWGESVAFPRRLALQGLVDLSVVLDNSVAQDACSEAVKLLTNQGDDIGPLVAEVSDYLISDDHPIRGRAVLLFKTVVEQLIHQAPNDTEMAIRIADAVANWWSVAAIDLVAKAHQPKQTRQRLIAETGHLLGPVVQHVTSSGSWKLAECLVELLPHMPEQIARLMSYFVDDSRRLLDNDPLLSQTLSQFVTIIHSDWRPLLEQTETRDAMDALIAALVEANDAATIFIALEEGYSD